MLSWKSQGNVGREQKSGIDGSSQSIGKRSDEWYVDDNIEVVTAYGGRRLGENAEVSNFQGQWGGGKHVTKKESQVK